VSVADLDILLVLGVVGLRRVALGRPGPILVDTGRRLGEARLGPIGCQVGRSLFVFAREIPLGSHADHVVDENGGSDDEASTNHDDGHDDLDVWPRPPANRRRLNLTGLARVA